MYTVELTLHDGEGLGASEGEGAKRVRTRVGTVKSAQIPLCNLYNLLLQLPGTKSPIQTKYNF